VSACAKAPVLRNNSTAEGESEEATKHYEAIRFFVCMFPKGRRRNTGPIIKARRSLAVVLGIATNGDVSLSFIRSLEVLGRIQPITLNTRKDHLAQGSYLLPAVERMGYVS